MELTLINALAQYGIAFLVLGIMIRYFMLELKQQREQNITIYERFIEMQNKSLEANIKSLETQTKLALSVEKLGERIEKLSSGVKCANFRGE